MRAVSTALPVVLSLLLLVSGCSSSSDDTSDDGLTVEQYRSQLTSRCAEARKQAPAPDAPLDAYYRDVAAVLRATAAAIRTPAPPASIRTAVLAQADEANRIAARMSTVADRLAAKDTGGETPGLIVAAEQAWTAWNGTAAGQLPPSCTANSPAG